MGTPSTTSEPKTISVKIEHKVSLDKIANLICSAFEGGSNYWYEITEFVKPTAITFMVDQDIDPEAKPYAHIDYPLNEGGAVMVRDTEDEDSEPKRLDLDSIQKGLKIMAKKYPRHMNDLLNDNDDAETGDVFLQCCLFGEVIFG